MSKLHLTDRALSDINAIDREPELLHEAELMARQIEADNTHSFEHRTSNVQRRTSK